MKILNWLSEIHAPILEPISTNSFFLTYFLIKIDVSLLHFEIFPFTNFPEDFPWPEYSSAKKLNLFFLANFKNAFGFLPSRSDIKPCKKTIKELFLKILEICLIFFVFDIWWNLKFAIIVYKFCLLIYNHIKCHLI